MSDEPLHILSVGMTCPVGLRWPAACAAIRAGISRRQMLTYVDNEGEPIVDSQLFGLDPMWTAGQRRSFLLDRALRDLATDVGAQSLIDLPLVVALDARRTSATMSPAAVAAELSPIAGLPLRAADIDLVTGGAYAGLLAISMARDRLRAGRAEACIVAAADSMIGARALLELEEQSRLLTERNSDGVTPSEGAVAMLLSGRPAGLG